MDIPLLKNVQPEDIEDETKGFRYPTEYLKKVTAQAPEYLLRIIGQVVAILLGRLNVSGEAARRFADQVRERKVGELFANFKGYDVRATRREARAEGRA